MQTNLRRGIELVAGAGVAAVLTIAAMIYAGRVIGPAEYADVSAGLAVIYLFTLALSPVIPTVARVVAGYATNEKLDAVITLRRAVLRIAASSVAIAALVAAIVILPASHWLRLRSWTTLAWAVIATLAFLLVSIDRGFLQGLFRFRAYNFNTVLESAIRAALVFMFVRILPAANFAMAAWAAGTVVAAVVLATVLGREYGGGDGAHADWREFLALLRPMFVLMLSLAIFQNTDVIAVKRFFTPQAAGAYGAASALARGFGVLFVPLYALAGPMLTEARERKRDVFGATLRLSAGYVALVVMPLIVIAIWRGTIITLLYGSAYASASAVLLPLCGVSVLTYVALMLSQGLVTVGDYRFTWIDLGGAAAQMVGLAFAHHSYRQVLTVLYVCQGVTLLLVTIVFLKSQKMMREGSSSNKV